MNPYELLQTIRGRVPAVFSLLTRLGFGSRIFAERYPTGMLVTGDYLGNNCLTFVGNFARFIRSRRMVIIPMRQQTTQGVRL
jgi:hypothetical protein